MHVKIHFTTSILEKILINFVLIKKDKLYLLPMYKSLTEWSYNNLKVHFSIQMVFCKIKLIGTK